MQSRVSVERTSRGYTIGGEFYPRVTSVLKNLPKPALVPWAAKVVAEYAVENKDGWADLKKADAIRLLKSVPDQKKDAAADRGHAVHAAIEAYLGKNPGEAVFTSFKNDENAVFDAALAFLRDYKPEVLAVEATLYSPALRYAGTCDLWVKINGEYWLLDWKTSKAVYPDYALQLCAYALAERAVVNSSPVIVMDDVGRYEGKEMAWEPGGSKEHLPRMGVIHITPKGYKVHEVIYPFEQLRKVWRALIALNYWTDTNDTAMLIHGEGKCA